MLRQYGERILLFNMNDVSTKEAFSTARETENGYILVSRDINLEHLEAVYDLEKGNWEFPYNPKCPPHLIERHVWCQ